MKAIDLFEDIVSFPALLNATRHAAKGKRRKPGVTAFLANQEKEILRLENELRSGQYRPGRYKVIEIFDPKHRLVSAAPFRDRVVHHALCAVCDPIVERSFIFDSYANRKGKGTHRAVDRYEKFRNRYRHVLRCDIYRYFPAIDHEILKGDLRRLIRCSDTVWLADRIIDASNPQEPVIQFFPGDDLLTPNTRRRGLPLGNLTSQVFANLYLNGLDHFCKEVLRAKGYLRYVDDFALFHDDPGILEDWQHRIAGFLEGRRLKLHPEKTFICPTEEPATFLGYVLLSNGSRRMPEANVRRFRNRLRGIRGRCRFGDIPCAEARQKVHAWIAHAEHADTWRLRQAIFRGGMFDPFREPDCPPSACCVAVLGTTIRGTCAPQIATGTGRTTATTTTVSASPVRSNARIDDLKGLSSESVSVQGQS